MNSALKSFGVAARLCGKRLLPVLLVALFLAPLAQAQQASDVRLDVSPQLFAIMTALRAGAPDLARRMAPPSTVTEKIDAALRELDPLITEPIALYLNELRFKGTHQNLSAFVSLAMVLDTPPNFEFVIPREQLPPDVLQIVDFPPLLKRFYQEAQLGSLWQSVLPLYDEVLLRERPVIARGLLEARSYLRLIRTGTRSVTYFVYPEWLVPLGLVSARNYGHEYHLVLHPARKGLTDSIRHQYLHFLLDGRVSRRRDDLEAFAKVTKGFVADVPRLPKAFIQDDILLLQESFVQAVEVRMLGLKPEELAEELTRRELDGYLFVRYLSSALAEFEEDVVSFDYQIADILDSYPVKKEIARLEMLDFSQPEPKPKPLPPPPSTPLPPSDPAGDLIQKAQESLSAQDFDTARKIFDRVLSEIDPEEERALYGLGLVASAEGYRFQAAQFFQRSVDHGSRPAVMGWANVYLGRIYDLEGAREEALVFYRAALDAGSGDSRIEDAARAGIASPFGTE